MIGAANYPNGLVFDSRVFTPLSDVSPAQTGDSGVTGMQHMAVLKDFRITYVVTNLVTLSQPLLSLKQPFAFTWNAPSNLTFQVQTSSTLTAWATAGSAASNGTNYGFTNAFTAPQLFFRVRFP